jgi:quinol monooxygenase YgiN
METKERVSGVVGLELRLEIMQEKRTEFLQMCRMMSRADDIPEGRLSQAVYEEVGESNRFIWIERWRDASSLDRYMSSERFQVLLGAIDILGRLLEKSSFSVAVNT